MELSKRERRRLRLEKQRQQSLESQKEFEQRQEKLVHVGNKPVNKWKIAAIAIALLIVMISGYSAYSYRKPGPYDNFAKCLTSKGAVMYGAMGWCKFTQGQRGMFGKSFKYVNYHEFNELQGIKTTPTWVRNGVWYEHAQSFEMLSQLTGCSIR